MIATSLSICVPNKGCDKTTGCANYCISKMTGFQKSNWELMKRNFDKVKTIAKAAQVYKVIITGKGEPTKNWDALIEIIESFNEFSIDLQTNGIYLNKNLDNIDILQKSGLDILAVSVDNITDLINMEEMFKRVNTVGMTNRVTINLTNIIRDQKYSFNEIVELCTKYGIDQLSFRGVTYPGVILSNDTSRKAFKWIEDNVDKKWVDRFMDNVLEKLNESGNILYKLPFGATLYNYKGISVTWFEHCFQDKIENSDEIRSLIFKEDGHLEPTWYSGVGRLL